MGSASGLTPKLKLCPKGDGNPGGFLSKTANYRFTPSALFQRIKNKMTQEVVRGLLTSAKHLGGSVPFGRSLHFFGFRFPYSSNDRTEPEKLAYWCKLQQSRNRLA